MSELTHEEAQAAARRAMAYPRGEGRTFFAGTPLRGFREAAEELAQRPSSAEHG